ncbi:hypothetical protein Tco_0538590, partial [Tanacetum coccineum]
VLVATVGRTGGRGRACSDNGKEAWWYNAIVVEAQNGANDTKVAHPNEWGCWGDWP